MAFTNKFFPLVVISDKSKRGNESKGKFVPQLSEEDAKAHAHVLKALGDPTRLGILSLLSRHEGEMCVEEITECFPQTQPTISSHLRTLRNAGLIEARKQGLWTYYYLKRERLVYVKDIVDNLA